MAFIAFEPFPGACARLQCRAGEGLAAAWVRVHQGSHDEPIDYPGLAHFLEHLLFLDGGRFGGDQGLMRFVQRCGGQVNASTASTYTDYFFQVPVAFLAQTLERLQDLFLKPLPPVEAQLREREVLHAEFLARSGDAWTQRDAAVGAMLPSSHPFSRFYAGHRGTLPVETVEFQKALIRYRARGRSRQVVELALDAPLDISQLQQLAFAFFEPLPTAEIPQKLRAPYALIPCRAPVLQVSQPSPALRLTFMFDGLTAASWPLLKAIEYRLQSPLQGGLLDGLQERSLATGLKSQWERADPSQAMLSVEIEVCDVEPVRIATIVAAVNAWIDAFSEADARSALRDYQMARRRCDSIEEPLLRIRRALERGWSTEEQALEAISATLSARIPQTLVVVTTDDALIDWPSGGFPFAARIETLHPPQDAFVSPVPSDREQAVHVGIIRANRRSESASFPHVHLNMPVGHAKLFLKTSGQPWSGDAVTTFEKLAWRAHHHGVHLEQRSGGSGIELRLTGRSRLLPAVAEAALSLIRTPEPEAQQTSWSTDSMPIRRLLADLPRHLITGDASSLSDAGWTALLCSSGQDDAPLRSYVGSLPLARDIEPMSVPTYSEYRWITSCLESTEEATLLLFCTHGDDIAEEAAFRLLARVIEGDFYQHMRVERQLGYAVFSGYRRFGLKGGILFAVQSPSVSVEELLRHTEDFVEVAAGDRAARCWSRDIAPLKTIMLADQGWQRAAEEAWLSVQAGLGADHANRLASGIESLEPDHLQAATRMLAGASSGWIALSNQGPPDSRWSSEQAAYA
jgi:coenzyme PQQ biosynthesis probable peptidase PqqF